MKNPIGAGIALFFLVTLGASGCSSKATTSTEDSSTSGSVASAIGGGASGSSSGGVMSRLIPKWNLKFFLGFFEMEAVATTACPTFADATLGTEQVYSECSFANSTAVWNGGVTFSVPGAGEITRLVANGTTRTAASGTMITVNTSGSDLTPFNGDSAPSGGTTFSTSSLIINGVNFVATGKAGVTLFNHVITTSSADSGTTLSLSGGTATGTVITYHQLAKVKATSVVNVTLSAGCCLPTGGTITTTFNTTHAGALAKFDGATEVLTLTGCGTGTYTGPEGYSGDVTLVHCL